MTEGEFWDLIGRIDASALDEGDEEGAECVSRDHGGMLSKKLVAVFGDRKTNPRDSRARDPGG
jgi:hypothetical protein